MRRISCRLLGIFALCAIASFSAGVSRADGVTYTLTGSTNPEFGPVHAESFSFTNVQLCHRIHRPLTVATHFLRRVPGG